jgi:hypothetical protein
MADALTPPGERIELADLFKLATDIPQPNLISAVDLSAKEFRPVKWVVPGLLPAGATLFAGAPKTGKSWLSLDLGIACACGGRVLGKVEVDPGDVLYLALEDNQRRLKNRLTKRLQGAPAPDSLTFATEWPRLDQGAVPRLAEWLDQAPSPRLVVIDTLARIRPPTNAKDSLYQSDYAIGAPLLKLAADHDIAVILVHHTRKGEADDPLEMISGSTGLTGGMDNVMVLKRQRGTNEAVLFVTGRDIEHETEYGLTWDHHTAGWTITGEGPHVGLTPERRAIFDIIAKHGPIKGRDIASALHPGVAITKTSKEWTSTRFLLKKLVDAGLVTSSDRGYTTTNTTNTTNPPNTTHTANTPYGVSGVSGMEKTANTAKATSGAAYSNRCERVSGVSGTGGGFDL